MPGNLVAQFTEYFCISYLLYHHAPWIRCLVLLNHSEAVFSCLAVRSFKTEDFDAVSGAIMFFLFRNRRNNVKVVCFSMQFLVISHLNMWNFYETHSACRWRWFVVFSKTKTRYEQELISFSEFQESCVSIERQGDREHHKCNMNLWEPRSIKSVNSVKHYPSPKKTILEPNYWVFLCVFGKLDKYANFQPTRAHLNDVFYYSISPLIIKIKMFQHFSKMFIVIFR
jgi:hypothetical protein